MKHDNTNNPILNLKEAKGNPPLTAVLSCSRFGSHQGRIPPLKPFLSSFCVPMSNNSLCGCV
eukprot:4939555-Amphidinium_carterae.1